MTDPAETTALITNDAVVLGMLAAILGAVFWASSLQSRAVQRFFSIIPALLLCYFIPALLNSLGIINGSASKLYPVARDYLLPTSLVLLCLAIDLGATQFIGGLSFSTDCGAASGVGWPPAILILVSDDGQNFRLAGELVALSARFGPPPGGGRERHPAATAAPPLSALVADRPGTPARTRCCRAAAHRPASRC